MVTVAMFSVTAFSQSTHFGIKAGVNLANMKFSYDGDSESGDMKVGFHVGAFGTYMFSDKIGIQPEILYSLEGSQSDVDGADEKFKTNLSYIQVPVLLRFQPVSAFNIHVGPQFGVKVASKYSYDGESEDIDGAASTVFGFAAGAGLNVGESLEIGARYTQSISDIADDDSDDGKTSTNVIQVFLAFGF